MTAKLFLGEGFLTLHDMKANGFDAHTANAVENLTRQKLYAKYGDQSPSPEIHAGFRWIAARELGIITEGKGKTKTRLDPKCWKGYKKQGTKMKGGVRVNNCVPESKYSLSSAKQYIREWGEDHEDGASQEEVANAIANRFMHNTDLMRQALEKAGGVEGLMASIDDVAEFHAGAEELGSSDISIMVREVLHGLGIKESKKKTDERKLTGGEKRSKEANFKKLKKHKGDFEKRYGKDAESVMHAVATKRAKGESIGEGQEVGSKGYFAKVAQAFNGSVRAFEAGKYSREVTIDIDGEELIISQKWGDDASPTKPITRIYRTEHGTLNLGRFAMWDDPMSYAEDIQTELEDADRNEDDYDDSMDGDHDSAMASAGWGSDEDYGRFEEDTMDALKGKFNSGPSDEMLRKRSEPWEEKVRADMAAGKDAGWFLDREQGAGQKWTIGTKTWFDVQKYQKKRSGIGSRLKRMVGMESVLREYTEAGYFTK